jgi:hypothetical protein
MGNCMVRWGNHGETWGFPIRMIFFQWCQKKKTFATESPVCLPG